MMTDSPNADRYLILLEQIEGQVQLITEAHGSLNEKLESIRQDIEKRFDRLEIKVDRNTLDIRELKAVR